MKLNSPLAPQAILFDHDGTLVDSEPIHCALWIEILASLGAWMDEAQYREYYAGVPTSVNAQDMVRRFNLPVTAATLRTHFGGAGFETIVSGEDVLHSKPAPDGYLLAARRLGVAPERCIAIEETATGLRAAMAAGVPCIAVPGPMSDHHDFSGAAHVAEGMLGAQEWIRPRYFPG